MPLYILKRHGSANMVPGEVTEMLVRAGSTSAARRVAETRDPHLTHKFWEDSLCSTCNLVHFGGPEEVLIKAIKGDA